MPGTPKRWVARFKSYNWRRSSEISQLHMILDIPDRDGRIIDVYVDADQALRMANWINQMIKEKR